MSTLYTWPIVRRALRKQSVQPGDILRMRERTDVAGIQIGIGIQRIRVRGPNELRTALVRQYYIPCTDLRYHVLTTARPGLCVCRPRRWCAYTSPYIAPRQSARETKARSTAGRYSHCRLPRIRYIASDTSKWSLPAHLIAKSQEYSDTIYRCRTFASERA